MQTNMKTTATQAAQRRGCISLEYLNESQRQKLRAGLCAVEGRTIYRWEEVEPLQASVLVLNAECSPAGPAPAIKLWLSDTPVQEIATNTFRLRKAFSAHELWSVLDLIALRLIDMPQGAKPTGPELYDISPTGVGETAYPPPTYRLLRWVTLEPPLHELRFCRAMAAMTRRDATLDWLIEHAGLDHKDACILLHTLNRKSVLQINAGAEVPAAEEPSPNALRSHFFNMVGRWLSASRRQLRSGN